MEVKVVLASEHTRRMRLRVLPPSYQSAIYYLRNRSTISSFVKYDVQAAFAIDSLNAAASNVTRLAASSSCSTKMSGTTDRGRRAGRAPYKAESGQLLTHPAFHQCGKIGHRLLAVRRIGQRMHMIGHQDCGDGLPAGQSGNGILRRSTSRRWPARVGDFGRTT